MTIVFLRGVLLPTMTLQEGQSQVVTQNTWAKTYGGSEFDISGRNSIQQTTDGGYIVVGRTISFGAGDEDVLVLKLDENGIVEWQKTYGGPEKDRGRSIEQTSDGGYIVAGWTFSFGALDGDIFVIKLDENGIVEWQKTYGGPSFEESDIILQTPDGGYIVGEETFSFGAGGRDAWLFKLDENGNMEWQKTYDGSRFDEFSSIQLTPDGGYVFAGETQSFGVGSGANVENMWVVKLDEDGNMEWQKTYGGPGQDEAETIQLTNDGGYIVAGHTESFGAGDKDIWILKLDSEGNLGDCSEDFVEDSNASTNNSGSPVTDTSASVSDIDSTTAETNAAIEDTDVIINIQCQVTMTSGFGFDFGFDFGFGPSFLANGTNFLDDPDKPDLRFQEFGLASWFKTSHNAMNANAMIVNKGGLGSGENMNYGLYLNWESVLKRALSPQTIQITSLPLPILIIMVTRNTQLLPMIYQSSNYTLMVRW